MPTYIYETVEPNPIQFELKQPMNDKPLTHHPETGVPVRRIISGGYGMIQKSAAPTASRGGRHGCGGGCGCGGH